MNYERQRIDRGRRGEYIRTKHGVERAWATEADNDPHAYWADPDPASTSGRSVRVIGYSTTAATEFAVILLYADTDPNESPDGHWWGANAWHANDRDTALYREQQ